MKAMTYEEMVREYRRRQHDTVVDTIATGLTYADEIAVETGVLGETGILAELSGTVTAALPFVLVAASEGARVILGRKPGKIAAKDTARRMARTGAAMGVGAAVTSLAGFWAAIPATMGVRALFDSCHSKALTGKRIADRIDRLHEINGMIRKPSAAPETPEALPAEPVTADDIVAADGSVV